LEALAEMGELVQAVCGVGGPERVDGVEHLAPGAEAALDDEVGLYAREARADAYAVEHLEGEGEFGPCAVAVGKDADAKGGVEEAEAREALALGAHLPLEGLEERERGERDRHRSGPEAYSRRAGCVK